MSRYIKPEPEHVKVLLSAHIEIDAHTAAIVVRHKSFLIKHSVSYSEYRNVDGILRFFVYKRDYKAFKDALAEIMIADAHN